VQDQPQAVKRSVGEFVQVLMEAVVIVLAVSFISLGLHTRPLRIDIWPGLVVGITIPAGAGHHLRHHVLLGRGPAQDLAGQR
jgi:multidrug efflux pump subunit AcrB